jgi:hypothetical protein
MSKHRPPPKPVEHEDDWFTAIQPHLPTIGIIAAAIVLVIFVIGYWMETTGVQGGQWYALAEAQSDFNDAQGEQLISLATKPNVEGTVEGAWAHLLYADKKLSQATRDIYVDRKGAQEKLTDAKKSYEAVEKAAVAPAMLKVRAQYGIAEVNETAGNLDGATQYYEIVAKNNDEKVLAGRAKEALDRLKVDEYREFSAWFASQPNREPAKKNSFDLNPSPLGGFKPGGLMGSEKSKSAPPAPKTTIGEDTGLPDFKFEKTPGDEGVPEGDAPGDTPSDNTPAEDAATDEAGTDEAGTEEPKGDGIKEPSGESPDTEEKTDDSGK